jgi:hypothetical protein
VQGKFSNPTDVEQGILLVGGLPVLPDIQMCPTLKRSWEEGYVDGHRVLYIQGSPHHCAAV